MARSSYNTKRLGGYSLLELVLAVALVGGTLAPALALIRDGIELSRKIDERQLLANYAVQKLEERMAILADDDDWSDTSPDTSPDSGEITDVGIPPLRYQVAWVDDMLDGDPNRLMSITSIVYVDEDGDDALDADEPQSVFITKISQLPSYGD